MGDNSSGGGASPLTARSMRLERVAQVLAHSQEELRRWVAFRLMGFFRILFKPTRGELEFL